MKIEKERDKLEKFHNYIKTEFVKKINLTNSAFVIYVAKNDSLTVKDRKSVILCGIVTAYITLFYFCTAEILITEKFFNLVSKFSCIKVYVSDFCGFILVSWILPPIRYP